MLDIKKLLTKILTGLLGKVNKSGDTMTGALTLQEDCDMLEADNGVSSVKYPTTLNIWDKNGKIVARAEGIVLPDGRTGFTIYARGYAADGSVATRVGFTGYADKSGNASYVVSAAPAFREAIGIQPSSATITNVLCAGHITGSNKQLYFFIPYAYVHRTKNCTMTALSLSGIRAGSNAQYVYMASGSGTTYTASGSGTVPIWANNSTVRTNEVASITCQEKQGSGFLVVVNFTYTLRVGASTTAAQNNMPVTVIVSSTTITGI